MVDKKISELNELTSPLLADLLAVVNSGATKNIGPANFLKILNLLTEKNPAIDADEVFLWDSVASDVKKGQIDNLGIGGSGGLVQWDAVIGTSNDTYGVATWADIPQMSITLITDASPVEINFVGAFGNANANGIGWFRLTVDGTPIGDAIVARCKTPSSAGNVVSLSFTLDVSEASHDFKVQWYAQIGTIQGDASGNDGRTLTVKEFLEV